MQQFLTQIRRRVSRLGSRYLNRCSGGHNLAAFATTTRANVEHKVCVRDHIQVMFNRQHRAALIQQALEDLQQGRIERAISRCRNIWASLPGAGYGQHEHSLDKLVAVWRKAGGVSA